MKKCCIRWRVAPFTDVIARTEGYEYTFSKIKYCPECGQSLEE